MVLTLAGVHLDQPEPLGWRPNAVRYPRRAGAGACRAVRSRSGSDPAPPGATVCFRAKASSCRVSSARPPPDSPDLLDLLAAGGRLPTGLQGASSALPRMTWSMLLNSWATPPASMPMDSSLCDWASWPRRLSRSVTSAKTQAKLARRGPERGDLEPLADLPRVAFEEDRLAAERHLPVPLDPVRLRAGQNLEHRPPDDVGGLQPSHPLEGRVDVQEAVVDRPAGFVADDLVEGEAVEHLAEEGSGTPPRCAGVLPRSSCGR